MPLAWGHTRLLETDWRLITQESHCFGCGSVNNQGVEVSGGEAQKIAIGRALYHEQSFLILDEPTAALDPIAEAEIYSQLNEIVGEKTAVFISHRLSSCRFSSRIFVFDKGEIVQIGTHESLVKEKDKKYAELWEAQAQYYTVVDKNKEQLA